MPVSGISRVTPPTITNVWTATIVVSPVASSLPNASSRSIADAQAPSDERQVEQQDRAACPSSPSSSPIAAKMKSVAAYGISVGDPMPEPGADDAARGHAEPPLRELPVPSW